MRHAAIALLLLLGQAPKPAFEVASVKRNVSLDQSGHMGFEQGGRFRTTNAPVFWLVATAYGEFQRPLFESQVIGAPGWTESEHYDITAKATADVGALDGAEAFRAIPGMLRALLEERFGLKAHRETRQMPIFNLVLARKDKSLGSKMTRSTLDCSKESEAEKCGFNENQGLMRGGSITTSILALMLSSASERVVVDKTGLTGRFDVQLQFAPDQTATDQPSLFAAVQEQLGLKLEATRGPVSVLVIDHVERPTED
jgi:uncharacterized protein (TIGR03435 family)